MKIYICICASNRPIMLDKTLSSLKKLRIPREFLLNIVLIDNNIYSNNKKIYEKYKYDKNYNIYYKHELKKGIVYARNSFLKFIRSKCKKSDYIGFIDDDCEVDEYWLISHLKNLKNKNIYISTGPQIPIKISNKKKSYYELTNKNLTNNLSYTSWAATNNVILKYSVLKSLQLKFDNNLNKIGGSDQLFFLKLNKFGFNILWNKKAIVRENIKEKQLDIQWFFKRNLKYGYSGAYISKIINGSIIGFLFSLSRIFYYSLNSLILIILIFKKENSFRLLSNLSKILGILKFYMRLKPKKYY